MTGHLTRAEVAAHYGISLPTVDSWMRAGCPYTKRGSRGKAYGFRLADVEAWHYERSALKEYRAEFGQPLDRWPQTSAEEKTFLKGIIHRLLPFVDEKRLHKTIKQGRYYTTIKKFHENHENENEMVDISALTMALWG